MEKATFVPLVFTTSGGMSPECEKCNKRIEEILAIKTKESYSDTMSSFRKKIRFALLKATLIAIRGYRGPAQKQTVPIQKWAILNSKMGNFKFQKFEISKMGNTVPIADVSYNLV